MPIFGPIAVEGHETHIAADSGKHVTAYKLKHVGGHRVALVRWSVLHTWVGNLKRSSMAAGLRLPLSVCLQVKRRMSSVTDNTRLTRRAGEIQSMLAALTDWASQHAANGPEAAFVGAKMAELFEKSMPMVSGVTVQGMIARTKARGHVVDVCVCDCTM